MPFSLDIPFEVWYGVSLRCERQLTEQLNEAEQIILNELVSAQHIVDSITALENFILGFRLGVRMMAECMDSGDGDIREVTDHG